MSGRVALLFAGSAVLQVLVATIPDAMGDLLSYRLWSRSVAERGVVAAYLPADAAAPAPVDYPPLIPLLLAPLGAADRALRMPDHALDTLIRLVFVLASLLLAWLLHQDLRDRLGPAAAAQAAALYLFHPGVVFDTAYWGQADAVSTLFVVGTAVALRRERPEWAWVAFALAVLTKPLAYAFAPVVLPWTLWRFGWRRTARCAAAFSATALVVCLPFVAAGRSAALLRLLSAQVDAMPYASVNAHNLWWLVQGGRPWAPADASLAGALSFRDASLALLAVFYAATLVHLRRARDARALPLAFASAAFGFFVLATHMHENHLFPAIPLLLLVGLDGRRLRAAFAAVSIVLLANLVLHDPNLTAFFRSVTPSAQVTLPAVPALDESQLAALARSGYTALVEQTRGATTWWGFGLTFANALLAVSTFALWLFRFYGRAGFDRGLSGDARLR